MVDNKLSTWLITSLGNNSSSVPWEQSCQCHLGGIALVSLGNNRASFTWEQLGKIVTVSLTDNGASVIWE